MMLNCDNVLSLGRDTSGTIACLRKKTPSYTRIFISEMISRTGETVFQLVYIVLKNNIS